METNNSRGRLDTEQARVQDREKVFIRPKAWGEDTRDMAGLKALSLLVPCRPRRWLHGESGGLSGAAGGLAPKLEPTLHVPTAFWILPMLDYIAGTRRRKQMEFRGRLAVGCGVGHAVPHSSPQLLLDSSSMAARTAEHATRGSTISGCRLSRRLPSKIKSVF